MHVTILLRDLGKAILMSFNTVARVVSTIKIYSFIYSYLRCGFRLYLFLSFERFCINLRCGFRLYLFLSFERFCITSVVVLFVLCLGV